MTTRQINRTALLTSFLQSFLIIPFWDLQILLATLHNSEAEERLHLRARLTAYGIALVMAVLGWVALHSLLGVSCCSSLTGLPPHQPIGSLIWPRLPATLGLLAIIGVAGPLICGVLVGAGVVTKRVVKPGAIRTGILLGRWGISGLLAFPPGAISLLAVLVIGVRFGWLPMTVGRTWYGLIIPGFSAALLPGLLAARRVEQALIDPLAQPQEAIRLAANVFYGASGWLLGGLALVEAVFGIDGLGKLFIDTYRLRDIPVFLAVLLLFLITTAIFRLHGLALESLSGPSPAEPSTLSRSERMLRLVIPLLVLAPTLLAWLVKPSLPDPTAIYDGADALGRDLRGVVAAAIRNGWLVVLVGTLVSVGLGGLWAVGIEALRQRGRHRLANGLRLPAEALILMAPSPLTVLLLLMAYPIGQLTGSALGGIVGLALIPRMVWGMTARKSAKLPSLDRWQRIGTRFLAGAYSVLQTSMLAVMLNGRVPEQLITPGTVLASYQDLIAGAVVLNGGPYLRLTLLMALPGLVLAWGFYLMTDTIAAGNHEAWLSDLFS